MEVKMFIASSPGVLNKTNMTSVLIKWFKIHLTYPAFGFGAIGGA